MNLTYIASSGNAYNLQARVMTKDANFHAWEFEPQVTELLYGERVSSFKKSASVYKTVFVVTGGVTQRKAVLTALHDDFENDVRQMQTGRIMYGNWYCDCYIVSSSTQPYNEANAWTENEVQIYVPSGFWVKEETRTFAESVDTSYEYLDYQYDYAYDFSAPSVGQNTWVTDSPFESDFKMTIHGACVNPRVVINGHPYLVYATIGEGETLVIDSREHTVMCGDTNLFDQRNKAQSVFEKIPSGTLTLSWGAFEFDLTLYEERSEPKWS